MRRLFILRHAQAMPADGHGDRERKLTPKGGLDAQALGQAMARKKYQPDFVLCSPAIRTKQTLEFVSESVKPVSTDFPKIIYEGISDDLLELVQNMGDQYQSVLLVGHNPAIHQFAASLAHEDTPTLMNRLAAGYAPATLTVLDVQAEEWADLKFGENKLIDFLEAIDYNAPATPARWT